MSWNGKKLNDPRFLLSPYDSGNLNRGNVNAALPCFGHFDPIYCAQLGLVGPCRYKQLCMKDKAIADKARKDYLDYSSRSTGTDKDHKRNLNDLFITRKRKAEQAAKDRAIIQEINGIRFIRK